VCCGHATEASSLPTRVPGRLLGKCGRGPIVLARSSSRSVSVSMGVRGRRCDHMSASFERVAVILAAGVALASCGASPTPATTEPSVTTTEPSVGDSEDSALAELADESGCSSITIDDVAATQCVFTTSMQFSPSADVLTSDRTDRKTECDPSNDADRESSHRHHHHESSIGPLFRQRRRPRVPLPPDGHGRSPRRLQDVLSLSFESERVRS
jgi:hypothetical protein